MMKNNNIPNIPAEKFKFVGVIAASLPIIIFPYYSVIGGWVTKYLAVFVSGGAKAATSDTYFTDFIAKPEPSAILCSFASSRPIFAASRRMVFSALK